MILADCENGTTTASAHNTTDLDLGYIIKIDGVIVDQGRLAPGERVERTYEVTLGESHFFRIRLGLTGDGAYFSTEGTADRTNCPTPSPSTSTTPPPSSPPPTSPPPTSTPPTSVSPTHGHKTPTTSVRGEVGQLPGRDGVHGLRGHTVARGRDARTAPDGRDGPADLVTREGRRLSAIGLSPHDQ